MEWGDPSALSLVELLQRSQQLRDDPERAYADRPYTPLRLAVIGTYTTSFLCRILEPFLQDMGIRVQLYEAPFGTLEQTVLAPEPALLDLAPQVTLLLSHSGDLRERPALFASPREVGRLVELEVQRWRGLWSAIGRSWGGTILQSNFEPPLQRPLGQLEARCEFGFGNFVVDVNRGLAWGAPSGVGIFDQAGLATDAGLRHALDPAQYAATKQPWSFDFLPELCLALARWVGAHVGRSRKCVVLDLDDTLWGGTVGEEGPSALRLGPGDPDGEAFVEFQRYLRALKERGILLAVNSKNDEDNARLPFRDHPHAVLREDDFSCFVANWQDKASNLREIARRLNIGLDSLVFVDNSAEERHLIREVLPEVAVVELPDDPSGYIRALQSGHFFDVPALTSDAARRTEFMRADAERSEAQSEFVDYTSYLKSLRMVGRIEALDEANLGRASELVQRTNQFNLRTQRHSGAQLQQIAQTGQGFVLCVYLRDRFGDHGMISVVAAERRGECLFVDTWLMSCRALKKTVEHFVMDELIARARALGVVAIDGEYLPTAKNAMVAEHYASMGFSPLPGRSGDAGSTWRLSLGPDVRAPVHHITREQ